MSGNRHGYMVPTSYDGSLALGSVATIKATGKSALALGHAFSRNVSGKASGGFASTLEQRSVSPKTRVEWTEKTPVESLAFKPEKPFGGKGFF